MSTYDSGNIPRRLGLRSASPTSDRPDGDAKRTANRISGGITAGQWVGGIEMRDNNITTAVGMYNAAALLLAEFGQFKEGSDARKAMRRSLIIPFAVVCILGIELALKSLIARQGSHYNKAHDLLELYNLVQPEVQKRVGDAAAAGGVKNVHGVLRAHRNGLQEWRYREGSDAAVVDTNIMVVLSAIISTHGDKYKNASNENHPSSAPPPTVVEAARRHIKRSQRGGPAVVKGTGG